MLLKNRFLEIFWNWFVLINHTMLAYLILMNDYIYFMNEFIKPLETEDVSL